MVTASKQQLQAFGYRELGNIDTATAAGVYTELIDLDVSNFALAVVSITSHGNQIKVNIDADLGDGSYAASLEADKVIAADAVYILNMYPIAYRNIRIQAKKDDVSAATIDVYYSLA